MFAIGNQLTILWKLKFVFMLNYLVSLEERHWLSLGCFGAMKSIYGGYNEEAEVSNLDTSWAEWIQPCFLLETGHSIILNSLQAF